MVPDFWRILISFKYVQLLISVELLLACISVSESDCHLISLYILNQICHMSLYRYWLSYPARLSLTTPHGGTFWRNRPKASIMGNPILDRVASNHQSHRSSKVEAMESSQIHPRVGMILHKRDGKYSRKATESVNRGEYFCDFQVSVKNSDLHTFSIYIS